MLIESLKRRYATKKFDTSKLVNDKDINTVVEAFNLTATSYGLQPLKLVVIKNKKIQENLVGASFNQAQVGQASHLLVICIDTNVNDEYINEYFGRVKAERNTPDEVLNPFKDFLLDSFSKMEQTDKELWATKQAYIALGNLLTVCASLNIDACPMEGFEPAKYNEILDLTSKNLKSVLALPIGYRAEDDFMADLKKVRKPLTETIININ